MKTIVVPVDFSTSSLNAAEYAVKMLATSEGTELVLYHMYEKKTDEEVVADQLSNLKKALSRDTSLKIETIAVCGNDLIGEIERVVHHRHANLVVMGIGSKTSIEKLFVASNTLKLVHENVVPVLIVPPNASFTGIKNVALASDFKDVRLSTPSTPIEAILELFHPSLHVVNVDSGHYVAITEEYQKEKAILEQMFGEYSPEFYFIGMNDFFDAIERFIQDKSIDILVTIPRQHSFFSRILRERHTNKLAYHTSIPLLAVHE